MAILYTSLAEIRSFNPCTSGWKNILAGQGKTEADDTQFPLVDCLKSNSISDVLWLLGKRRTEIQIAVKFARDCADSVAHLTDKKVSATAYAYADAYAAADAASASDYADAASTAAASATASAGSAAAYIAAYKEQTAKQLQFLINRIKEYEESH